MGSGSCAVLLIGRPTASLSTQKIILERAGYSVSLASGEEQAMYLLKKHGLAASVLSLPDQILQTYIFTAVVMHHTVPMKERHRLGAMVRNISNQRPKLLVLHRSGNCAESHADAAIDSREGQEKILALLNQLIEGKHPRRIAAAALNIKYVDAEPISSEKSAAGKKDGTAGRKSELPGKGSATGWQPA